jgi:periplasmic protein TonB
VFSLNPTFEAPSPSAWAHPPAKRSAALLVLALHALAVLGLLQAGFHTLRPESLTPVSVALLSDAPRPPDAPPAATPAALLPHAPRQVLPVPEIVIQTAGISDRPSLLAATQPQASLAATAPQASLSNETAPRATVSSPKAISASSLRYRVEPAVEVPRLSRRAGEQGRVQLRVIFDIEGRPQDIQLLRSSGFARLDAQALEAMQAARIAPYLEDGHAIPVMAVATLEYQLDGPL